jgi:hypothetical protein
VFSFLKASPWWVSVFDEALRSPKIFQKIAKNPELIVVTAFGLCFSYIWFSGDILNYPERWARSLRCYPFKLALSGRNIR